jgi:hypothetical protein
MVHCSVCGIGIEPMKSYRCPACHKWMCSGHRTAGRLCPPCTVIYHDIASFKKGNKKSKQEKSLGIRLLRRLSPVRVLALIFVLAVLCAIYYFIFPGASLALQALLNFLGIVLLGFTLIHIFS